MIRNLFLLACLSAVFAGLTGCHIPRIPPHVSDPTAKVTQVRVASRTAQGVRLEADVEVDNPNEFPLPLTTGYITMTLGEGRSYSATAVPNRTLPAKGRQTMTLAAAFAMAEGARVDDLAFSIDGSLTYLPPGELRQVLFDAGIPMPTIDFAQKGQLRQR